MFERTDDPGTPGRPTLAELAARAGLTTAPRAAVIGMVTLAVVALGIAGWRLAGTDRPDDLTFEPREAAAAAESEAATEPAQVWVHVAGRVRSPGLYELVAGARAGDALAAAGGPLQDAEIDAINLARVLSDGEQVYVPSAAEAESGVTPETAAGGAAQGGGPGAGGTGGTIDINRASAAELDALPGVGASTAAKIIADREANGPFATPEDLMRVAGIGEKKFEAMRDMVAVR